VDRRGFFLGEIFLSDELEKPFFIEIPEELEKLVEPIPGFPCEFGFLGLVHRRVS